ncbi:MAG TPA: hypothetical protein VKE27_04505 [Candidatus Dormibacteraeota bacterium]|nr:hypothetical protein [Candidatus Dormibacteraeota bacterium]
MKEKITRRATLKAVAASAIAGGAWVTNLAVPELIHAATKQGPPPQGSTFGVFKGAELGAVVDTFLSSSAGKALSAQVGSFGHSLRSDLADGGWFGLGGERIFAVTLPYGDNGGMVAAVGPDLNSPQQAGASRVEQINTDLFKITSYGATGGAVQRTHVFIADRAHKRIDVHDLAKGTIRTVTHDDIQRMVDALQPKPAQPSVGGATPVSADSCGWCQWITMALVTIVGCGGIAWLSCFVLIWDPPVAAACGVLVGVFGHWVFSFLCWALGLGFGASYGCWELGYCSCPYPWGC